MSSLKDVRTPVQGWKIFILPSKRKIRRVWSDTRAGNYPTKHLCSLGTLCFSKQEDKESEECVEGVNMGARKARKAFEGMDSLPNFFLGKICSSRGWKHSCKKSQKTQGQALTSSQTAAGDWVVSVAGNISSHCMLAGWLPALSHPAGHPRHPSALISLRARRCLPPLPMLPGPQVGSALWGGGRTTGGCSLCSHPCGLSWLKCHCTHRGQGPLKRDSSWVRTLICFNDV